MSEESTAPDLVEMTRQSMEAANLRDFDAAVSSIFAPDAVFDMSAVGLGSFEGATAIRTYLEDWIGAYEEQEYKQWEGCDLGGGVVFAVALLDARPVGSPGRVQERWAFTVVWTAGMIVRVVAAQDIDEARAAAERLAEASGWAMSQKNVKVAKQAIEAFNRSDVDAFAAVTTPGFEWSPSMAAIEGEIFRGREGIDKYFGSLNNAWERFHILPDRFHHLADLVVMLGRLEGRGKGSGVPVDASLGMVFDFRGGTISRIRGYLDHGEALRAAGLSE